MFSNVLFLNCEEEEPSVYSIVVFPFVFQQRAASHQGSKLCTCSVSGNKKPFAIDSNFLLNPLYEFKHNLKTEFIPRDFKLY